MAEEARQGVGVIEAVALMGKMGKLLSETIYYHRTFHFRLADLRVWARFVFLQSEGFAR